MKKLFLFILVSLDSFLQAIYIDFSSQNDTISIYEWYEKGFCIIHLFNDNLHSFFHTTCFVGYVSDRDKLFGKSCEIIQKVPTLKKVI